MIQQGVPSNGYNNGKRFQLLLAQRKNTQKTDYRYCTFANGICTILPTAVIAVDIKDVLF